MTNEQGILTITEAKDNHLSTELLTRETEKAAITVMLRITHTGSIAAPIHRKVSGARASERRGIYL